MGKSSNLLINVECDCSKSTPEGRECFQCGIPITGKPLQFDIDGEKKDFCCFGCYLIYKTTGLRGEEGTAVAFLGKFGFGFFLSMLVFMLSTYLYGAHLTPDDPQAKMFTNFIKWIILILATPVMAFIGIPILRNAINNGRINISTDLLVALGSFSAYFLSVYSVLTDKPHIYFETATMILVLLTFGRYIETSSRAKASSFMRTLMNLSPDKAIVIREGKEVEIEPEEIKVGDIVKITPGEKISADGIIIEGKGYVDESLLTGETKPVFKTIGDELFTGTTNIDGVFKIKVNKPTDDWTLNRFIALMKEIRNSKAPINRITDTVAFYFLPVIITIASVSSAYWFINEGFEKALIVFLSVLLISCPCAFSIGAPLALWVGLSEAIKEGIIIKGADILEKLSSVKKIFFDKTGTITERNLTITDIYLNDKDLKLVCCLESNSEHPIGKSIVSYCKVKDLECDLEVKDIKVHFGYGIEGLVDGKKVYIGSKKFMEKLEFSLPKEHKKILDVAEMEGKIPVFIAIDGDMKGLILFGQKIKKEASKAIDALRKLGINVAVLTGDTKYFADVIKKKLNINEVYAELLPEDKVRIIDETKNKNGLTVGMVGDGINDAPALTKADIGIAMGCGTDLTRESANINLLSDDLRKVPLSIILAKKVKKVIYTNIFWAFIYNVIGIGLAVMGKLSPIFSALAMILSSAFVIANSLRIKNW